jgi:trimeric autotransporter adhesin
VPSARLEAARTETLRQSSVALGIRMMAARGLTQEADLARQAEAAAAEIKAFAAALDSLAITAEDKAARLVQLEETQAAERAAIIQRWGEQAAQALRQAGGTIRAYLDSLATGTAAGASPSDRLAAAQANFERDRTLSMGGDRDALGRITGSADALLAAGRDMFASSPEFQSILASVKDGLGNLPVLQSYDAMQAASLEAIQQAIEAGTLNTAIVPGGNIVQVANMADLAGLSDAIAALSAATLQVGGATHAGLDVVAQNVQGLRATAVDQLGTAVQQAASLISLGVYLAAANVFAHDLNWRVNHLQQLGEALNGNVGFGNKLTADNTLSTAGALAALTKVSADMHTGLAAAMAAQNTIAANGATATVAALNAGNVIAFDAAKAQAASIAALNQITVDASAASTTSLALANALLAGILGKPASANDNHLLDINASLATVDASLRDINTSLATVDGRLANGFAAAVLAQNAGNTHAAATNVHLINGFTALHAVGSATNTHLVNGFTATHAAASAGNTIAASAANAHTTSLASLNTNAVAIGNAHTAALAAIMAAVGVQSTNAAAIGNAHTTVLAGLNTHAAATNTHLVNGFTALHAVGSAGNTHLVNGFTATHAAASAGNTIAASAANAHTTSLASLNTNAVAIGNAHTAALAAIMAAVGVQSTNAAAIGNAHTTVLAGLNTHAAATNTHLVNGFTALHAVGSAGNTHLVNGFTATHTAASAGNTIAANAANAHTLSLASLNTNIVAIGNAHTTSLALSNTLLAGILGKPVPVNDNAIASAQLDRLSDINASLATVDARVAAVQAAQTAGNVIALDAAAGLLAAQSAGNTIAVDAAAGLLAALNAANLIAVDAANATVAAANAGNLITAGGANATVAALNATNTIQATYFGQAMAQRQALIGEVQALRAQVTLLTQAVQQAGVLTANETRTGALLVAAKVEQVDDTLRMQAA